MCSSLIVMILNRKARVAALAARGFAAALPFFPGGSLCRKQATEPSLSPSPRGTDESDGGIDGRSTSEPGWVSATDNPATTKSGKDGLDRAHW